MSKLSVWVRLPVQPGKREEAAAILRDHAIAHTLDEEGTLLYILNEDPKDPDTLYFFELYRDQDAATAHSSSDWYKALGPKIAPFVAGRPEITRLTPLAGKGL